VSVRRVIFLPFAFYLVSAAFAGDVQMDVQLGFDAQTPLLRTGAWSPVTVTLRNAGADVEGVLRISTGDPGTERFLAHEHSLAMPRNATKQVQDMVFLPHGETSVAVEWRLSGKVDLNISAPFQPADRMFLTVLIVGDTDSVRVIRTLTKDQPRTLRPVLYSARMESLPDHPFAYDGIDTVILDHGEWSRMLGAQADALRGFVESGGNLVISTGRVANNFSGSALNGLLPVLLQGTAKIAQPVIPIPNVVISANTQLLLAHAVPKPGVRLRIVGEEYGRPIVAEAPLGLGRVTFLAFQFSDPVLREWQPKIYLWNYLFARRFTPSLDTRNADFEQDVNRTLERNTLLAIPTADQIGLFLLVYVAGIIPVNHLLWRLFRRPLWAWWILPVLSLGIGVAVVVNERIISEGNLSMTELSIVHTRSGCDAGLADNFLSVQSPFGARFEAVGSETNLVWLPVERPEHTFDYRLRTASRPPVLSFEVGRKELAVFRGVHAAPIARGLEAQLEFRDGKVSGKVRNRTGWTFHKTGMIEPGGTQPEIEVVTNATAPLDRPAERFVESEDIEEFAQGLINASVNPWRGPVFWGLAGGGLLDLELRDASQRSAAIGRKARWTLVVCDAPYQLGEGAFAVTRDHWRARVIAAGVEFEKELIGHGIGRLPRPIHFPDIALVVEPDVDLSLDPSVSISRLELVVDCPSSDNDLTKELYNLKNNTWQAWPGQSIGRDQALPFLHPRTGALYVRLSRGGDKDLNGINVALMGERRPGPRP